MLNGRGKISRRSLVCIILDKDPGREQNQAGFIDANGNAATFTGKECYNWAGGVTGPHFAAQGNILVDENTVKAMADTFQKREGNLAERLLSALQAGQNAGGDSRGQQSAALLVVKDRGGYGGFNDRYIDLRVEDHEEPIKELTRIYQLQQLYFAPSKPENIIPIEGSTLEELTTHLKRLGYLNETITEISEALTTYIHTENFEEREQKEGFIDSEVLEYMKKQK